MSVNSSKTTSSYNKAWGIPRDIQWHNITGDHAKCFCSSCIDPNVESLVYKPKKENFEMQQKTISDVLEYLYKNDQKDLAEVVLNIQQGSKTKVYKTDPNFWTQS